MSKQNSKILSLDCDGTLFTTAWPEIGRQRWIHKMILWYARRKQMQGWEVVLNTMREGLDHKDRDYTGEVKKWCYDRIFYPDRINENPKWMEEKFGYSRKVYGKIMIDDHNFGFLGWLLRKMDK